MEVDLFIPRSGETLGHNLDPSIKRSSSIGSLFIKSNLPGPKVKKKMGPTMLETTMTTLNNLNHRVFLYFAGIQAKIAINHTMVQQR